MAGFLWRSARAPRAIIDLGLFQRPGFAALNAANAMVSFAVFAVMLVGPFYLARIAGLPPLLLGLVLAMGHGAAMLGATVAGQVIARVGAPLLVHAGAVMAAGGLFGVVMWEAETPLPLLMLTLAVQGFGAGLFVLAYADVVTATMRREDRGVAGSLTMLTRTLGVVASASLLTLLFGTSEAALLAGGSPATDAFLGAFAWVFVVAGTLPLLALPLLRARRT
jgi:Na+/melibiose symporter-like transporter